MALQNCKGCGKVMGETPSGFCEKCKTTNPEYSNLHRVRDYLYDHPNTVISVVSEDTGVSVAEISRFIRDGTIREISVAMNIQGGKCSCGGTLEADERTCKVCKQRKMKAAEQVKRELTQKIAGTAATTQGGFFTKQM